jgi:hypothetical protein
MANRPPHLYVRTLEPLVLRGAMERAEKTRRLIGDAEHAQPVSGLPESFRSSVRINDSPTIWDVVHDLVLGLGADGDVEEEGWQWMTIATRQDAKGILRGGIGQAEKEEAPYQKPLRATRESNIGAGQDIKS